MNSTFFIKAILILVLIVFLFAPFTFLKPLSIGEITENKASKQREDTKKDIVKKKEKPLHNVTLPDFSAIRDVKEKKKQFFDFIRPAIVKQNIELLAIRVQLEKLLGQVSLEQPLSDVDTVWLNNLAKQYRVKTKHSILHKLDELLFRVDIVPAPLALVQAANESAWGTSRFSRIGLNFFGIWCYRQGCGMVPNGRNIGAKHEVAAFNSVDEAVTHYFKNINTNNAYIIFRTIRSQLRAQNQPLNSEILATGLLPYSERGADYVIDITTMLRQNQKYFQPDGAVIEVALEE
ncbi:MAG: glucosaminidase domain-containing protein [Colwellia sp.]